MEQSYNRNMNKDILSSFSNYLQLNASFNDNLGLQNGKAAVALYMSSLEEPHYRDYLSFTYLEEILRQINTSTPLSFGYGIAGIGALVEYFKITGNIQEDTNAILSEVDISVLSSIFSGKVNQFNIENGICGLGIYLLARYDSPSQPSPFQKMRFKESVIFIIEQLSNDTDKIILNNLNFSIWSGFSGLYIFLVNVHVRGWYEPITKSLLVKIQKILIDNIVHSPFSWRQLEVWFVLLAFEDTVLFYESNISRNEMFRSFLLNCLESIGLLDFRESGFFATLLLALEEKIEWDLANVVLDRIVNFMNKILQQEYLSDIFPFNEIERCVPIGLKNGVCSMGLPLASIQAHNCSWLKILGFVPYTRSVA